MGTYKYAACMRSLYGSLAASKVMPPVNALQGSIVCGFYTIFHDEEGLAVELLEIVKEGCVDTIRSGANHNPYHIIYRQSLFITSLQHIEGRISIGVCLEIGKVFHGGIFPCKERLSFR